MGESFAELFEESLKDTDLRPGALVTATVEAIDDDWVTVNAGLKSEGVIPRREFTSENGELSLAVGDEVEVAVVSLEDGFGSTSLSRLKARQAQAWRELETAYESGETVEGQIVGKVRGGLTVELDSIRAFLPGSLVDVRPVRDTTHLEGQTLEFKLIKLDARRNNIVVSRRAVLEEANSADREKLLKTLTEGMVLKGVVKNLTDYGAFIDLGGVDGLLHITDLAWKRVRHPSEVVSVGQELDVKVLRYDRESGRVSLGLKQLGKDPWEGISQRYPANTRLKGRVTNITDYGCFAEIEDGIEGLVHVSEMDWTNKNIHPSRVVQLGEEIDVMVLDIDEERRRISLGMKQCVENPWETFGKQHNKGDRISGVIRSITDFGIFVGLEGGIDGLVHLSDLSWEQPGEEVVREYAKGDTLETQILAIDQERERVSLGVKQLEGDPFMGFVAEHDKGALVTGEVIAVEPRGATLQLTEGVEAQLKASELSVDRVDDAGTVLKVGETIEVAIINVDRKKRLIGVSLKAKAQSEDRAAMKALKEQQIETGPTTIGDLIKEQLGKKT
ncbi:30S ribosomal protein S1 [Motiliproteus sp. SC1-56]|uniref:30S ribosomal protein S1 n=1 Tax=Motiliproteus sp. SC1-56 TaxID=2799565 RepID=UPI001A8FB97E|nr:30S ribosomal protein S1 [Motiliproteus sp. SC1-56]